MQIKFLKRDSSSDSLKLIFSGYGQDEKIFSKLTASLHGNVAVVFDYQNLFFDVSLINNFKSIYLFAWSMGVMIAPKVLSLHKLLDRVEKSVAINGTIEGIDEEFGIAPAMWQATIDSISERNVLKFYLRMCTDKSVYDEFLKHACSRSVDELRNELEFIKSINLLQKTSFNYSKAYVGTKDRIFPSESQIKSWSIKTDTNMQSLQIGHFDIKAFTEIFSND